MGFIKNHKEGKELVYVKETCKVKQPRQSIHENNKFLVNLIVKGLLILLGLFTNIFAFTRGMDIEIYYFQIWVVSTLTVIIVGTILNIKKYRSILLMIGGTVLLVYLFLNMKVFTSAIGDTGNAIIKKLEFYFEFNMGIQFEVNEYHAELINIRQTFYNSVSILITIYLMFISWKKIIVLGHLVPSIVIVLLLLNVGVIPDSKAIMLYMFYVFLVLVLHNAQSSNQILSLKLQIHSAITTAVILVALVALFTGILQPIAKYDDQKLYALRERIDKIAADVSKSFDGGNEDKKGLKNAVKEELNLENEGDLDYKDTDDLRIRVPNDNEKRPFYLKGFVGTVYENNKWLPENKEVVKSFNNRGLKDKTSWLHYLEGNGLEALILGMYGTADKIYDTTIAISNVGIKNDIAYMPYCISNGNFIPDKAMQKDRIVLNSESKVEIEYHIYGYKKYLDIFDNVQSVQECVNIYADPEYLDVEQRYRKYVYEVYTKVPNDKMQRFAKEFSGVKLTANGEVYDLSNKEPYYQSIGLQPYIDYVTDYLRQMEYTLKPGKLNKGNDFVEDFLFEKKKGYCVYFASAATLMFREMGIPARYVEGYIVKESDYAKNVFATTSDTTTLNIKDRNAHAWVEIYQDGFGWIPVEVTTGFGRDMQREIETVEAMSTKPKETTKPEQATTKKENDTTQKKASGTVEKSSPINWKPIIIIISILCIPFIIAAIIARRRAAILRRRYAELHIHKLKKQLLKIYRANGLNIEHYWSNQLVAEKVAQIFELEEHEKIIHLYNLLDKSVYGSGILSKEEIKQLEESVNFLVSEAQKRSGTYMRFKIKYIWCFL